MNYIYFAILELHVDSRPFKVLAMKLNLYDSLAELLDHCSILLLGPILHQPELYLVGYFLLMIVSNPLKLNVIC